MKRKIELYGRLRDAGHGSSVIVDVPRGASARQTLAALKPSLGPSLAGCVLASASDVLAGTDLLPPGRLALLPPVCGG